MGADDLAVDRLGHLRKWRRASGPASLGLSEPCSSDTAARRSVAAAFARIAGIPKDRLHELLPREWKCATSNPADAQAA